MPRIALIGDFNASVLAHRAIPKALALSAQARGIAVEPEWVHTSMLTEPIADCLNRFDGIWVVPASPYANMNGVLAAIRFARESHRPFLGTCGGFQHAVIEYARNVWEVSGADHAETSPDASQLVVSRLTCSLVEKSGTVHLVAGTNVKQIYACERVNEEYHCNYGLNPDFAGLFSNPNGLRIAAQDDNGEVRAVELTGHPFFVATLYQPERSGLKSQIHPLVSAFVASTASP